MKFYGKGDSKGSWWSLNSNAAKQKLLTNRDKKQNLFK